MKHKMRNLKFIDLFAGLGGFHLALSDLGHSCVFASEKRPELISLYRENFNMNIAGDINKVNIVDIPHHDILCAGFPCQPFSHAGNQLGLSDPANGNFFNKIMEIVNYHLPEFIFLENVPNLRKHDGGKTWDYIHSHLSEKYEVSEKIISPHELGVPQHRRRMYIVCRLRVKGGLDHFRFPQNEDSEKLTIHSILDEYPENPLSLKKSTKKHLNVWQEFLNNLEKEDVPSFPIWAMEFGADYDYEITAPAFQELAKLKKHKGKFGEPIVGNNLKDVLDCLPIYARTKGDREFPTWKRRYIKQNREFYLKHRKWLDKWIPKIINFENSHQKLEWNCGKENPLIIFDKIVQFRPSGIRIKQPNYSPALVLTVTQIPIFPWLDRYMTINEAAKLQCMENLKVLPDTFKAFGNAVNVCVVKKIAQNLLV